MTSKAFAYSPNSYSAFTQTFYSRLTLNLRDKLDDIFPKEVSFEVLSPWMRLIDPNTLLDIMQPILKLSKPIPKFLAFISDNMPSNDTSVSKMVRSYVITT